MKQFAILIFAVILIGFFINIGLKTKAQQNFSSGQKSDDTVTINDKQIVTNYSTNNGHGSTEQDYIIFTDKGAYTCGFLTDKLSIYGQLQVGHTYEIWTSPSFDFQREGCIIKFKEVK